MKLHHSRINAKSEIYKGTVASLFRVVWSRCCSTESGIHFRWISTALSSLWCIPFSSQPDIRMVANLFPPRQRQGHSINRILDNLQRSKRKDLVVQPPEPPATHAIHIRAAIATRNFHQRKTLQQRPFGQSTTKPMTTFGAKSRADPLSSHGMGIVQDAFLCLFQSFETTMIITRLSRKSSSRS